ncbi:right-handed parallel beta-helix repeat-containing protein [Kribbella sandramycini]|uniref:Right-handed parallel beta-helix repeat-containing protein n=1 Tax=Kribbella sandramycini TaxID=60450 RepID=A0A7Y4L1R9_9ACTN|nr:right-handed parallel beta-helix repeat-containing protein [Kribbella sandramycini]MBB6566586.1 hypothetical protein [Kribbella sandramycini]NOL42759.1 right-handed parallel beta-helix repeat-containing protein [Kribbella sandramycini]
MSVIDVTDFGSDRTAAVEAALAHARTLDGPKRLVLPPGTHDFYPDHATPHELYLSNTAGADPAVRHKRFAFFVDGIDDLTIDGQGAHLQLHGQLGLFAVLRSSRVTLTNFAFDHTAPRVVDLAVVETGPGYRILQVPADTPYDVDNGLTFRSDRSPYDGTPYWQFTADQLNYQQVFDPEAGLTTRRHPPLFADAVSIDDLGNQRLRVNYPTDAVPSGLGLVYALRETTRDTAAGFIWESTDVTVAGLTARYLHGFGILGQFSTDIVVFGNEFAADRSTGRVTGAFADFVQMSGVKGKISIVGNTFDGAHDDAINIHGTYLPVTAVDGRTLHLRYAHDETAGFPQFYVGDELEIINRASLQPVGAGIVTAVAGPTGRDSNSLTTMSIELATDVPAEVAEQPADYAVENTTYTPEVRIAGNTFRNLATRAVLLTTRGVSVIEDNIFDGIDMESIQVAVDASGWYESGPVRDLVIRRNTFRRPTPRAVVIRIHPENTVVDPATPVHHNIRIEANTFELAAEALVVDAKSTKSLAITNNLITRPGVPEAPLYTYTATTDIAEHNNTYQAR